MSPSTHKPAPGALRAFEEDDTHIVEDVDKFEVWALMSTSSQKLGTECLVRGLRREEFDGLGIRIESAVPKKRRIDGPNVKDKG
jgi:hypothetical protein